MTHYNDMLRNIGWFAYLFPRASYMTMHVTLNCLGLLSYVVEIKSILVQGKNKVFDLATSRIFSRGDAFQSWLDFHSFSVLVASLSRVFLVIKFFKRGTLIVLLLGWPIISIKRNYNKIFSWCWRMYMESFNPFSKLIIPGVLNFNI